MLDRRSILPYLVPNPDDREPVSATTLPHILLPTFLLLFLGYLARRPNTYLIRLALLPFVVWTTLWAMFAYYVPDPEQNSANFSKGASRSGF